MFMLYIVRLEKIWAFISRTIYAKRCQRHYVFLCMCLVQSTKLHNHFIDVSRARRFSFILCCKWRKNKWSTLEQTVHIKRNDWAGNGKNITTPNTFSLAFHSNKTSKAQLPNKNHKLAENQHTHTHTFYMMESIWCTRALHIYKLTRS